ncbi:MAG: hypothetical protein ACP5N3_01355 [Candidatus Nanoarchaeia archaeon]
MNKPVKENLIDKVYSHNFNYLEGLSNRLIVIIKQEREDLKVEEWVPGMLGKDIPSVLQEEIHVYSVDLLHIFEATINQERTASEILEGTQVKTKVYKNIELIENLEYYSNGLRDQFEKYCNSPLKALPRGFRPNTNKNIAQYTVLLSNSADWFSEDLLEKILKEYIVIYERVHKTAITGVERKAALSHGDISTIGSGQILMDFSDDRVKYFPDDVEVISKYKKEIEFQKEFSKILKEQIDEAIAALKNYKKKEKPLDLPFC